VVEKEGGKREGESNEEQRRFVVQGSIARFPFWHTSAAVSNPAQGLLGFQSTVLPQHLRPDHTLVAYDRLAPQEGIKVQGSHTTRRYVNYAFTVMMLRVTVLPRRAQQSYST
jgi:hypothetical protein